LGCGTFQSGQKGRHASGHVEKQGTPDVVPGAFKCKNLLGLAAVQNLKSVLRQPWQGVSVSVEDAGVGFHEPNFGVNQNVAILSRPVLRQSDHEYG
jgi:hypothetical protein